MSIQKITTTFIVIVGVLSAFFLGKIIYLGEDAIKESIEVQSSVVDPLYTLVLIMLVLAIVFVLCFSLFQLVNSFLSDSNQMKKILVAILGSIGIFVISYTLASDEIITFVNGTASTAGESKWTGIGLIMFYILGSLSLLSIIGSGILKLFK